MKELEVRNFGSEMVKNYLFSKVESQIDRLKKINQKSMKKKNSHRKPRTSWQAPE